MVSSNDDGGAAGVWCVACLMRVFVLFRVVRSFGPVTVRRRCAARGASNASEAYRVLFSISATFDQRFSGHDPWGRVASRGPSSVSPVLSLSYVFVRPAPVGSDASPAPRRAPTDFGAIGRNVVELS